MSTKNKQISFLEAKSGHLYNFCGNFTKTKHLSIFLDADKYRGTITMYVIDEQRIGTYNMAYWTLEEI